LFGFKKFEKVKNSRFEKKVQKLVRKIRKQRKTKNWKKNQSKPHKTGLLPHVFLDIPGHRNKHEISIRVLQFLRAIATVCCLMGRWRAFV
jgi:hypothetical protein